MHLGDDPGYPGMCGHGDGRDGRGLSYFCQLPFYKGGWLFWPEQRSRVYRI